jgi:hypothetical protein
MLYIYSIIPSFIWHHHDHHIVSIDQADPCEKAIYYDIKSEHCHHKAHLTQAIEKCSICDHHTLSAHTLFHFQYFYFNLKKQYIYIAYYRSIHSIVLNLFSNRGPPLV